MITSLAGKDSDNVHTAREKCSFCSISGHSAEQCYRKNRKCFVCHAAGHFARDCDRNTRSEFTPSVSSATFSAAELPKISVIPGERLFLKGKISEVDFSFCMTLVRS